MAICCGAGTPIYEAGIRPGRSIRAGSRVGPTGDYGTVPAAPMWSCPHCGRSFANRNQSHACARLGDLDQHHWRGTEVRAAFDRVLAAVSALGPVEVLPEKTLSG